MRRILLPALTFALVILVFLLSFSKAPAKEEDKKAAKALGFLMGRIMKASKGKAPPADVKKLLENRIQADQNRSKP